MSRFKCECKDTFATKQSLERHISSGSCRLNANSKTNKKNMFKCHNLNCKSKFPRADSLKRHMKNCKYSPKKCKGLIKGNKNTLSNTNDGNISNYNNSIIHKQGDINIKNINLVVFGKDGPESMFNPKLIEILNSGNNLYESALKIVNFDPKCPKHHNVYCNDLKSGNGHVYGENGWSSKRLDEILEKILDSKTSDFNQLCDLFGDHLSEKTKDRIKNAIGEVRGIGYDGKIYPPGARKKLKTYIKNILYDNREMVKETRNKTLSRTKKQKPRFDGIPSEEEILDDSIIDDLTIDDLNNDDSCEEI